jgi:DNA-binding beta-propeller fold protein YncE
VNGNGAIHRGFFIVIIVSRIIIMNHLNVRGGGIAAFVVASLCAPGCASAPEPHPDLVNRAYVVSRDSDDLTVIDLNRLEVIGVVHTAGIANHMAELNADFTKLYVDSESTNESIVVDATKLSVVKRIPTGDSPTHISLSRDGNLLALVNEYGDSVSFIDPASDTEIKRLSGFFTPHFVRFAPDSRTAYVANIGAYHITRVDLVTLAITDHIALDGFSGPPDVMFAPNETGFADVQIDPDGMLYAAHNAAARVLIYDTVAREKVAEHPVGPTPWIVYAQHPFDALPRRPVVPSFGDQTVSVISRAAPVMALPAGDMQSFGVNYSPLVPNTAFVMNRVHQNITVIDTALGTVTDVIPTGGNTETASTTPDGKLIVAAVSSSNQVVVIDAVSHRIVKTFDHVGVYPWSVTIPLGQNYCH